MVVPDNQLMETAMGLARRLASGPTLAISWTKMAVNKIVKDVYNSVADSALAWELHTFRSKDHEEAARAFLAKRKAKFQGI
jgi:enoyl-CoA hydratase